MAISYQITVVKAGKTQSTQLDRDLSALHRSSHSGTRQFDKDSLFISIEVSKQTVTK
jgi:hypothetical protein